MEREYKYKSHDEILEENKSKFLQVNSNLNDLPGIYILTRIDENEIKYAYIGQSVHILTRLAEHLMYYQHIDLSLKKHGLYSEENPYGWKVDFIPFSIDELDVKEQEYIKSFALAGYQLRNKTAGGQGTGKTQIAEYKSPKGYRDGILQGKKTLARELSNIWDKHLDICIKEGKQNNKTSIRMLEKFKYLLDENNYN